MKGLLAPEFKETLLGHAEVRNVFHITGAGTVAGCYVLDGKLQRNAQVRLLRDNVVSFEGKLSSLKRFKDDAKEVLQGFECGVSLDGYNDIKEGDTIECFIMDDIDKRLHHLPMYMGVDAGYHNAPTCHQIAARGVQPVVGYRRHTHKGEFYGKYRFTYDPQRNVYICPQKHELTWRNTNREGYREYWSDGKTCKCCPRRAECFGASTTRRLVTRHVWQDDLERADTFTKTEQGKCIYAWRKETIERSFAEAKELHGLRFARMLGIRNMYEQSFLTAAVQNMNRIAKALRSFLWLRANAQRPCFHAKTWPLSSV